MEHERIISKLSKIPSIWTINGKHLTPTSFQNLDDFIGPVLNKIKKDQQNDLKDYPYHQSLIHFLLYFSYHPKIPFVIKTKNHLFFASFYGRNCSSMEISIPFQDQPNTILQELDILLSSSQLSSLIKELYVKKIILRDIPDDFVNIMRSPDSQLSLQLSSLKELYYQTYDLKKTLTKKGHEFANLRWHLNKFKAADHTIEEVRLTDQVKPVIHLIGEWKKTAITQRGFSFINVKSDKQAARLFGEHPDRVRGCISRILKIDGRVASFNFGYPLGFKAKRIVFAHAIGIADLSIPHLAEYAQYDFWKQLKKNGYEYVNDGPSWRQSLEVYKQKFRPIQRKRYYFATLRLTH